VTGWKISTLLGEVKEKMSYKWDREVKEFPQDISTAEDLEREVN